MSNRTDGWSGVGHRSKPVCDPSGSAILDESDVKLTSAFQPRKQLCHHLFELGWAQHSYNPSIQAHLLDLPQNYSRGFSQITLKN